jgi:phosphatidate phosphatase APP1
VLPAIAGHSTLREHKLASIATILATYPARRFVLLGDSGQQDPEIYYQATLDHPGRIAAVYIRDVSEHQRDTQIDALRPSYAAQGVPLIYAGDIGLFAEDGIARGLLRADARARIQSKSR